MPGEGFPTSIGSSSGFKGEAASLSPSISQKMPRPVHQGFTPHAAQTSTQSIYILAIRNMMEQGFHSFVSVESEGEQQPLMQSPRFGRGFTPDAGQRGAFGGAHAPNLKGRSQNEFLASTPQYLLPQFQRSSARGPAVNDYSSPGQASPRGSLPGGSYGQSGQGISQTVMNEFNQMQRKSEGPRGQNFSNDDAESLLLEHYRSTFSSSKDSYKSKFPFKQQPSFSKKPAGKSTSSSQGVYAEAYQRGLSRTRKGQGSPAGRSSSTGGKGSSYNIKMGGSENKTPPQSGDLSIKMEPPGRKKSFTLGSGESMIRMKPPAKEGAMVAHPHQQPPPQKTPLLRPSQQEGAFQERGVRQEMLTPDHGQHEGQEMRQHPGQEMRQQPGQELRQHPGQEMRQHPGQEMRQHPGQEMRHHPGQEMRQQPPGRGASEGLSRQQAPAPKTLLPQPSQQEGAVQPQGVRREMSLPADQKGQHPGQEMRQQAGSEKTPVEHSRQQAPVHKRATSSSGQPGTPVVTPRSKEQPRQEITAHRQAGKDKTSREQNSGKNTLQPEQGAARKHEKLFTAQPSGLLKQSEKPRPEILRTRQPGKEGPGVSRDRGAVREKPPSEELPKAQGKPLRTEPPKPSIQKAPVSTTVEQKAEKLLQQLEQEEAALQKTRQEPVKGKERLYKPWEAAMKKASSPQSSQKQDGEQAVVKEREPLTTDQKRRPATGRPTANQPPAPKAGAESSPAVLLRENHVEKLRQEVKLKLESPQSQAVSQKPAISELAAKSGVIQGEGLVKDRDSSSTARKAHFEELAHTTSESKRKDPFKEKAFAAKKGASKAEAAGQKRGDGPIEAIRGLGERAPLAGGAVLGSILAQEEGKQAPQGRFDLKQGEQPGSHKIVDEVQRHQRQAGEQQDEQGFQDQSQGRKQGGKMARGPRPEAALQRQAVQQQHIQQDTVKQQIYQRAFKDSVKMHQARAQEPVKQTRQAVKHANTCIESILKKSHRDTWTGDEMAAKLIAIMMRSASLYTYDHSSRVTDLSIALAKEMGVDDEARLRQIEEGAMFHDIGEVELDLKGAPDHVQARLAKYIGTVDLKNCSFLHDIGKVKIPDSILYKPDRLTDEEFEIIKQHPIIGEQILKPIPALQHALPVVRHHHEKWDGTGYPDGLKGSGIPLSARIVGIADAFDAMVSDRPYRKGMSLEKAVEQLQQGAGTQFDPELVEAFLTVIEKEYHHY